MVLTDKQKAALVADGDVNKNPSADVNNGEDAAPDDEEELDAEQQDQVESGASEEDQIGAEDQAEKPSEDSGEGETESEETPATFTKQFPNLKGNDWQEYGPELETAYQNSFTEGIRLKGELDKALNRVRELETGLVAQPQPPQQPVAAQPPIPPAGQPSPPLPPQAPAPGIQGTAEFQWLQSLQQAEMRRAFGDFMKVYPQVSDTDSFKVFSDAVAPVTDMFSRIEGRQPTYDELFPKIADVLGWQPAAVDGKRGQDIKDSTTHGSTVSTTAAPARGPAVSDAEMAVFLRLNPGMSRTDALKEISKIKSDPMAATR
jgi:hypothetical protein